MSPGSAHSVRLDDGHDGDVSLAGNFTRKSLDLCSGENSFKRHLRRVELRPRVGSLQIRCVWNSRVSGLFKERDANLECVSAPGFSGAESRAYARV